MLGDCVQAVGVLIAALLIYFRPDWKIADPITTFVFAILVLLTTVPIFITSMRVLLEFAPEDMDTKELFTKLISVSLVNFHLILVALRRLNCGFPRLGS